MLTFDKEKIVKQTGPLPEKVVKEVDGMSGVGALMLEKGRAEGRAEGRIKALYYDAGFSVEEIAEKTGMPEEEIKKIISLEG